MRVVFAGTPDVAVPSLSALLDAADVEVVGVVTRPDRPAGRGRQLTASPVKQVAEQAGVEVLQPVRVSDPAFLARLADLAPDVCPVVAYGALIPAAALSIPPYGWVNLHFSLLPAHRGAAPVQHAILAGDDVTGATAFVLDEGLDTGPVLGVMTTAIGPDETAGDLLQRLATDGAGLLLASVRGLVAGAVEPRPQPAVGVSLAPKLSVDDARLDWSASAVRVQRVSRACTPSPGAWTTFRDRRLKLGPVRPSTAPPLAPGALATDGDLVLAGTATQPVTLGTVQPEGRAPMPAAAWVRGVRLGPGDRLQ
jgi:methionyl-tRNA formyltransferase